MPERLTARTLALWRAAKVKEQGGLCEICGLPFTAKDPAVGDHDHDTGLMRGAVHRSCNSMLGKIENSVARYGMRDPLHLYRFLKGVTGYIAKRREDAPYYPTHRTPDEKRELRNKRARAARAAKKGQA